MLHADIVEICALLAPAVHGHRPALKRTRIGDTAYLDTAEEHLDFAAHGRHFDIEPCVHRIRRERPRGRVRPESLFHSVDHFEELSEVPSAIVIVIHLQLVVVVLIGIAEHHPHPIVVAAIHVDAEFVVPPLVSLPGRIFVNQVGAFPLGCCSATPYIAALHQRPAGHVPV